MLQARLLSLLLFLVSFAGYAQCGFNTLSPTYCTTSPSVQLSPFVGGGLFYGTGVTGLAFDPGSAGSGVHAISYSYCAGTYSLENETFVQAAYNPTIVTLGDNTISSALPIGFTFRFFCNSYSQFYISSNGFITFTPPQSPGCCQGLALPTGTIQNDLIAVAWTDLDPSQGGTIRYSHLGTAPNRTLLVSYNCIFHKYGQGPVTAEILLHEGSDMIEFSTVTKPVPTGTVSFNTTMGIQGANGMAFTVPGRNGTSGWVATQEQIRFIPEPVCFSSQTVQVVETPTVTASASPSIICPGAKVIVTAYGAGAYSWTPGNVNYASYSVAPTATTIYSITGTTGPCSSTTTLEVNVTGCAGLNEQTDPSDDFTVFPVPGEAEVTLMSKNEGTFYLIDGCGRVIDVISLSPATGYSKKIKDLKPGMYSICREGLTRGRPKRIVVLN